MPFARGMNTGVPLHVAASLPFSPCCRRAFLTLAAPAQLGELRMESISLPDFSSSTSRPSPPAAAGRRQAGGREAAGMQEAGRHTRTAPAGSRPQRARGPWLPARLQCPAPLRVPSPAAPPALARSLPASASRSRLCPDLLPLLPLRREACRAASAPQLRRGSGACGEQSGAAPGALSPPAAAPAVPRGEGRKPVLNHRPDSFPGPAPQVAKARARTQPACHAAILYLTGWFLPASFGPK